MPEDEAFEALRAAGINQLVMHMLYTVWTEGMPEGDIFKGYNNKQVSTHLDKRVANRVADLNSGWVEEEEIRLHPDYVARLERDDRALLEAQNTISSATRSMLRDGG